MSLLTCYTFSVCVYVRCLCCTLYLNKYGLFGGCHFEKEKKMEGRQGTTFPATSERIDSAHCYLGLLF